MRRIIVTKGTQSVVVKEHEKIDVIFYGGKKIEVELRGEESEARIFGLVVVGSDERAEFSIHVRHCGKKTRSQIRVLSILEEGAVKEGVMRIDFERGAKLAQGREFERVMMVGNAQNKSRPVIKTLEEDVRGEHGLSIGRFDDNAKRYFEGKGIDEEEAKKIMTGGAIEEMFEEIGGAEQYIATLKETVGAAGIETLERLMFGETERFYKNVRDSFPQLLHKNNRGKNQSFPQVIYFDNAATTMRPARVVEAMRRFYLEENANIRRGLYPWSVEATRKYEEARKKIAEWVGAEAAEVVFTRGASESLNLAAIGLEDILQKGDEIVVSELEHHSNMLPWVRLAERAKAKLVWLECEKDGQIAKASLDKINAKTKIVAITAWSNVVGKTKNLQDILTRAQKNGAISIVDATQAVQHQIIDVKKWGADLVAWSAHKMFGPMGIGALYGRKELLDKMKPMLVGGEMVEAVEKKGRNLSIEWSQGVEKFEAGTMNVAGAIGWAEALEFLQTEAPQWWKDEEILGKRLEQRLKQLERKGCIKIVGGSGGLWCFKVNGVHAHDVAEMLGRAGVATRAGFLCAQPLVEKISDGEPVVRASIGFYNTEAEIEKFCEIVKAIYELR